MVLVSTYASIGSVTGSGTAKGCAKRLYCTSRSTSFDKNEKITEKDFTNKMQVLLIRPEKIFCSMTQRVRRVSVQFRMNRVILVYTFANCDKVRTDIKHPFDISNMEAFAITEIEKLFKDDFAIVCMGLAWI